eukprot:gene21529-41609_t
MQSCPWAERITARRIPPTPGDPVVSCSTTDQGGSDPSGKHGRESPDEEPVAKPARTF